MKSKRPIHHPDQIMSAKELKVGDKIIHNNINYGQGFPETIISFGYYPLLGVLQKTFRTITENGFVKENFFTDYGIEPYKDNNGKKLFWNRVNYTLKIKETKE